MTVFNPYHDGYSFNTEKAIKYGVEEAIVLNFFEICIRKNMANKKHFHDGKYWFYMSIKAFTEVYPFWSAKQIRRILKSLKDQGAILEGVFNKNKYDQTKWYTLGNCIFPNGQIENPKRANEIDQMGKPIPSNTPSNTPSNSVGEAKSVFEKEIEEHKKIDQFFADRGFTVPKYISDDIDDWTEQNSTDYVYDQLQKYFDKGIEWAKQKGVDRALNYVIKTMIKSPDGKFLSAVSAREKKRLAEERAKEEFLNGDD